MKTYKVMTIAFASAALIGMTGCTDGQLSNPQEKALLGAAGGAIIGGLVDGGKGAAIGAALGGVSGAAYGAHQDSKRQYYRDQYGRTYYIDDQGRAVYTN
jgi:uncharacterized protein YcfJ